MGRTMEMRWTEQRREARRRGARPARALAVVIAAVLCAVTGPRGFPASVKLSPDLTALLQLSTLTKPTAIIVQTSGDPSIVISLVETLGGRITATWTLLNGFAAVVPASSVSLLAQQLGVTYITPDREVRLSSYSLDWGEAAIGAPNVWSDYRVDGTGVGVAIVDSGIQPHADLRTPSGASRIAGWVDLVNSRTAPYDDFGHGTHVAGIVAGNGASSGGGANAIKGVAPGVRLFGVKVLNDNGEGTVSAIISGLDWVARNRNPLGIQVVNLSLGHPIYESAQRDPLARACELTVRKGLVVVVSAGNEGDGYGGITSPGDTPSVITVGAMTTLATPWRDDDRITSYTSRGPTNFDFLAKPDVVAPGDQVASLRAVGSTLDAIAPGNRVPSEAYGGTGAPAYFCLSGTSMAAPHVAGAAALLLQRNPGLNPNMVKAALMHSAEQRSGFDPFWGDERPYDELTEGAGYVNLPGALAIAASVDASRAVGSDWLRAPLTYQSSVGGMNVVWGRTTSWANNVTWGRGMVWGQTLVLGRIMSIYQNGFVGSVSWGQNVTWGRTTGFWNAVTETQESVWGHNVTWGRTASQSTDVLLTGDGD